MADDTKQYVNFFDETGAETDSASLRNRINNLYTYRNKQNNFLYSHGFVPTSDFKKFLTLKALDSSSVDVIPVESTPEASSSATGTDSDIVNNIQAAVEGMQAEQFVQMFLDSYIAPKGSDVIYRLGDVTGVKAFAFNPDVEGQVKYDDYISYAQYDEYGRIDTAVNFRLKVDIPGTGETVTYKFKRSEYNYLRRYRLWIWFRFQWVFILTTGYRYEVETIKSYTIPSTTEYYTNWFFPPYRKDVFDDGATLEDMNIDNAIKGRRWDEENQQWVYPTNLQDYSDVTFDTERLLSMRPNPTYRSAAFKAVNDNISLLQHIFEQTCGIVSTYMTEWDLSLYIQEGILEDKNGTAPSLITLMYRVTKDNPSGYTDSKACVYGALNSAVSKTPFIGFTPNTAQWTPYNYPLSTYWYPYTSQNRGDGLDVFYDTALKNYNARNFEGRTFREKVKLYDELGAAYSGWYNWDDMSFYKLLYTTDNDGMGDLDIIQSMVDIDDLAFADMLIDGEEVDGVITQIINSLYDNDDSLGFADDEWEETVNFPASGGERAYSIVTHYKRNHTNGEAEKVWYKKVYADTGEEYKYNSDGSDYTLSDGSSSSGGMSIDDSDITILGVTIPGSRLLKLFLKRDSIKNMVMRIANKGSSSYSAVDTAAAGTSLANNFITTFLNPTTSSDTSSSSDSGNIAEGTVKASQVTYVGSDENSTYTRQDGVSQWAPAIYGGPHGKYYSPKTIQGYFEVDNKFLRNVPRYGNLTSSQCRDNNIFNKFDGNNSCYSATKNSLINVSSADRSPSWSMSLMEHGFMDYIDQMVYVREKTYVILDSIPSTYKGETFYYTETTTQWYTYTWGTDTSSTPTFTQKTYLFWDISWGDGIGILLTWRGAFYFVYSRGLPLFTWDDYKNYTGNAYYVYKTFSHNETSTEWNFWRGFIRTTTSYYTLKVNISRPAYKGYIYEWKNKIFKRPLMHSDTSVLWNINNHIVRDYSMDFYYVYRRDSWWGWWWSWWYRFTRVAIYSQMLAGKPEQKWRLSFPDSNVSRVVAYNMNGEYLPEIRYQGEQDFMDYVSGNTSGVGEWHRVAFFASKGGRSERFSNGPDMIFMARVRTNQYTFLAQYTHQERQWFRGFHHIWFFVDYQVTETRVCTAQYIEVDMDTALPVYSGMKGNIWNNLDTLRVAGDEQEINKDIPPDTYKVEVVSSSKAFASAVDSTADQYVQTWAGYTVDETEVGLHGWGYTCALPGFSEEFGYMDTPFENGNDYLCLSKFNTRNTSISSLTIPFWYLSSYSNSILQYGTTQISTLGMRRYSRRYADEALINAIRRLYYTSTFYKQVESETSPNSYLQAVLVSNDSPLRTLARIAVHQKAWLEKAKEVFLEVIEFKEIQTIIEKTVDQNILAHSFQVSILTGEVNESYNKESCLYHPWIVKAYEFYKNGTNKTAITQAFDTKIGYLTSFLSTVNHLIGRSAQNWSSNDFDTAVNASVNLKKNYLDTVDETMEEYMYAYLNVLYEYRKYFINKRCNKVDGTYWILRELEGAIPMMTHNISEPSEYLAPSGKVITSNSLGIHQYSVKYYMLSNSVYEKYGALIDESVQLPRDRVYKLYITVKYTTEAIALNYLNQVKNGETDAETQRYIYISEQKKYAELPFDDIYQYISNEWQRSEAITIYNNQVDESRKLQEMDIDKCVFNIVWAEQSADYANGNLNKLGMKEKYPYVYDSTKTYPRIKFDVNAGIDPQKVINLDSNLLNSADAFDIICTIQDKEDYWVVTIPHSAMPRRSGYRTKLKIKSYREDYNLSEVYYNYPASVAGAFGYMLYPITEEQANVMPGIGLNLAQVQEALSDRYLSNVTRDIETEIKNVDTSLYDTSTSTNSY